MILSPTLEQAEHMHQILAVGKYSELQFRYPTTLGAKRIALQSLLEDCTEVIKEESIDVVISLHPGLEFVQCTLMKRFPQLKGPSLESVFLCLHRYYAKEVTCDGFSVNSEALNIDDVSPSALDSIIEDLGSPVVLKEAFNFDNSYSRKIKNGDSLYAEREFIKDILQDRKEQVQDVLAEHLDTARYEKSMDLCFLLEEYVKPGKHTGTLHLVEGCVVDEMVVPWAISDVGIYKHKPVVVKYVVCPSELEDSKKFDLWAVYREVAGRLIAHGFNNQFLELEIFVGKGETEKILSLRPSLNPANVPLYRHVLMNGDSILGQVSAGREHVPREPRAIPNRYALRAKISAQVYNITLDQVVDKEAADNIDGLTMLHTRNDYVIEQGNADEDGVRLGDIRLYATSHDECVRRMKDICKEALKDWKKPQSAETDRSGYH